MTCPACEAYNIPTAERCKCGYAFRGLPTEGLPLSNAQLRILAAIHQIQLEKLTAIEQSLSTIKKLMIWWFVVTLFAVVLWIIESFVAALR